MQWQKSFDLEQNSKGSSLYFLGITPGEDRGKNPSSLNKVTFHLHSHEKAAFCCLTYLLSLSFSLWTMFYFLGYTGSLFTILPEFGNNSIHRSYPSNKRYPSENTWGLCSLSRETSWAHRASVDLKVNSGCGVDITPLKKKKNNFKAKGSLFSLGISFLESLFIDFPCNNWACKL